MTFNVSPGVYPEVRDFSQIVSQVAQTPSAIVGASNKGPSFQRILVTSDDQYKELFGIPDSSVSFLGYSALGFLKDGNQLYVTRVHNGALFSGVVVNTDTDAAHYQVLSAGEDDIDSFDFSGYTNGLFAVFAENEGSWGNNLSIVIDNVNESANTFQIFVYLLENGNNILKETWTVSREMKLDGFGQQLYLEERINGVSKYIRVKDNVAEATSVLPKRTVAAEVVATGDGVTLVFNVTLADAPVQRNTLVITTDAQVLQDDGLGNLVQTAGGSGATGTVNYDTGALTLTYTVAPTNLSDITADYFNKDTGDFTLGVNGSAVTDTELVAGWDLYSNPDVVDVSLLINSGYSSIGVQSKMKSIAESRRDCFAILDGPASAQSASSLINFRRFTQNFNSSYTALYGPYVRVQDTNNNVSLLVPPSGYIAGVFARTDFNTDPWFAPAGLRRGLLDISGVDTYFDEPTRDILYANNQINPIRSIAGQGNVVWGQRTQQVEASALDRINVRRLLIVLEKSISKSLLFDVFDFNDELTRTLVENKIRKFLEGIQSRRGVTAFDVIVDTNNNPQSVISQNQMIVDIIIVPNYSAEFIKLRTTIVNDEALFEEVLGTV